MNKLDLLFEIAAENNISIEYVNFPDNIQGLYFKDEGIDPVIGINNKIISDPSLFTCVLAEELGHHFTTVGDCAAEYYSYSDRLIVNKKETLALKWATELLMPLNEIVQAVKDKITDFHEIASYLQVTEQFLLKRFEFISKRQPYIEVDKSQVIMLTKLPCIYLMNKF
jgi:Zn-dependent peptidase ImmA (M78 family)